MLTSKLGVGGDEGAFIMVTFWLVEAMMRVRSNSPQRDTEY